MILGSHVSCAGGLHRAVQRALDVGCDCLQIFVSNPPRQWPLVAVQRQKPAKGSSSAVQLRAKHSASWKAKPLADRDVERWKKEFEASGLVHPIAHASYLINLGSPKDELFHKSIEALVIELDRANQLELEGLVVHPGAYTDSSEEEGLKRVVDAVTQVLARVEPGSCSLLLENTAGQGSSLGYDFEQLAYMLDGIGDTERMGICLDTCHAFAAGYELNTKHGFADMRKLIDDSFPPDAIKALHLNDSKKPLGSRVDRHEHIGRGEIGLNGFRLLLQDAKLGCVPGYLETEKGTDEETGVDWDVINLRVLRQLAGRRRSRK